MKLGRFYILLWFCLICYAKMAEGSSGHFPRIVWSYWHQGFEEASTFTKLCLNNQRHYAEASGWTYNLLTKHNLHLFLDLQKVEHLWKMNGFMIPQVGADIVRMSLLLKYGGMWMDANSFFTESLEWIDTIKQQPHFYNKIGEQPDVILGSYSSGFIQSTTINQAKSQVVPNLEDWFMIAIPNSTFFQEVMKTIEKVVSMGRLAANDYYASLGVNNPFSHSDYFLMSNYIFQVIIQLKQIQLKNNSNTNFHAINYYKIWNMQAYKTAFIFLSIYDYKISLFIEDIIQHNISMYQSRIGGLRYFVKLNGAFYKKLNVVLDHFQQNFCFGFINQIKKGSILSQYLLNNLKYPQLEMIKYNLTNISEQNCRQVIEQGTVKYGFLLIVILSIFFFHFIYDYLVYKKSVR